MTSMTLEKAREILSERKTSNIAEWAEAEGLLAGWNAGWNAAVKKAAEVAGESNGEYYKDEILKLSTGGKP